MSAEKDSSRDVAVAVLDENRHDSPTLFNDPEKSSEQISSSSSDDAENPRPGMSGFVWALVLVAILSSHFLYALDNTVVADIQPAIISTLGEIDKYPWISVAFVTAAASVTLVWGKIYGHFNGKHAFLVAVFLFEVGTAICASAPNMDALIIGRTICGIGAGGIYTGTMFLISALTTVKERPMYLGLTGLTWGAGTVLGPVIGGAFAASSATWRWGFYIGLCIGAAAAPVYLLLLPSIDIRKGTPILQRLKEFDFIGSVLIIASFLTGIMAISFGGALYDWNNARIIALFVLSGLFWITFGVQQSLCVFTTPQDRLFPVEMLRDLQMVILFVQAAASVACVFVPIYFIPLYFQFVKGDEPLQAAVRLLPFIFTFVFATVLNGVVMSKTGYYMPWYLGGGILILIGGVLMFLVEPSTSASYVYGASVLISLGAGSFNQGCFAVAQAKSDATTFPLASAFIAIANVFALSLSLAVSNSIFFNEASHGLAKVLPNVSRSQVQSAIVGVGANVFEGLDPEKKARTLEVITGAISNVYAMIITSGVVVIVFAVFMGRDKLFVDQPEDSRED